MHRVDALNSHAADLAYLRIALIGGCCLAHAVTSRSGGQLAFGGGRAGWLAWPALHMIQRTLNRIEFVQVRRWRRLGRAFTVANTLSRLTAEHRLDILNFLQVCTLDVLINTASYIWALSTILLFFVPGS